jgi:replicative DNA helicase
MIEETKVELFFNPEVQDAVIGHCMLSSKFFLDCKSRMKPSWFSSTNNAKLFDIMVKFSNAFRRHPTVLEIQNFKDFMLEEYATQLRLIGHFTICMQRAGQYGLDVIEKDLTAWLTAVIFTNGVKKAVGHFNNRQIDQSYAEIMSVVKEIRDASFQEGYRVTFADFEDYLQEDEHLYDNAFSTGLSLLDQAILNGAVGGAMLPGELTIILAPINVGKTMTMLTMAVHNAMKGKKVLFLAHEGTKVDLRSKALRCALGVTRPQLLQMVKDETGRTAIREIANRLEENFIYIHYEKPGMCIEDIEPIIYREQERLKSIGSKIDMIFDDYPDKLRMRNMSAQTPERMIKALVYTYFGQICADIGAAGVAAVQTNRDGSKAVKAGERLVGMEDTAEAWGIPAIAATMISLNRQITGACQDIMTFFVCKTRSNVVGGAVACKTDLACARMHSDTLGAIGYMGNIFMPDRMKIMLEQGHFKNQILTPEQAYLEGDLNDH